MRRFAGGAQLDSQSNGAFASYRAVSYLRRHHLRNCRPRAVLRESAQDVLRQYHSLVSLFSSDLHNNNQRTACIDSNFLSICQFFKTGSTLLQTVFYNVRHC